MTEPMTEPTRDLVDREELRREFAEAGDHTHTPKWRTAFRHARAVLDSMPSVECPRGWTRDEVLHELDTLPGAVAKALGTRSGAWYELRRSDIADWHPKARFYDVRVVLPEPPVTVWVPLTKLVGRTLPGETEAVMRYEGYSEGVLWFDGMSGGYARDLDISETGMVEVLAEGDA